jgi:hypothetical protein
VIESTGGKDQPKSMLPKAESARVERGKIVDYLLSVSHIDPYFPDTVDLRLAFP